MSSAPRPPAEALLVAGLALAAAALRLSGLDWDQGHHLHPDERFLTMVSAALETPGSWARFLDTEASPLNPANQGFPFFVYGTLPVFLVRGIAGFLGADPYAQLHLVGRGIAALFDLGTVLLGWGIGRAVAGPRVGLGTAALLALCVASIQHAHFYTVDAFGAFFAAAAILAALRIAGGGGLAWQLCFGAGLGAALACRINLVLLAPLLPLALAAALAARTTGLARAAAGGLAAVLASGLVFRLAQPYAFTGPGFFDLALDSHFLATLRSAREMVAGRVDFPPAAQWIGRTPVLFPMANLATTSLGVAWAAAAALGLFVWLRGRGIGNAAPPRARWLAAWALAFLLYHGSQFVSTQRYFLPVLPVLAVAAALLAAGTARWQRRAFAAVLLATGLWALAFHGVYRAPHSRVQASRWMAENLPAGATIATEQWDDALPLPVADLDPDRFARLELALHDSEDRFRRGLLRRQLDSADYIVTSSDRLYGSLPRAPWRYALGRRYYELLFSGALGFEPIARFRSRPRLGPLEIPDEWSEEAFRVYDHPTVHVFAKASAYRPERTGALLGAVRSDPRRRLLPAEGGALYRRGLPSDLSPGRSPPGAPPGRMGSGEALGRWLLVLAALGAAGLPVARRLLPGHPSAAALLALLAPWVVPGFAAWWLASLGQARFDGAAGPAAAATWLALGAGIGWRDRRALLGWWRAHARQGVAVVAAFGCGFAVFALLRAANPTIFWGEKPMDLALLGALARARGLPPADPWFAGEPLNYFHLGHALVVSFGRLAGVPLATTWNLALASLGGWIAAGALVAGRQLGASRRAGVLALGLVLFSGNLAALRLWLSEPGRPLDFGFFWSTSRVIPGTINEFPFWSLLFGDLHAHVLALPFELALVALGCTWLAPRRGPRGARLLLVGGLLGITAATSPWSAPVAFAAQGAFLLSAQRSRLLGRAGAAARLLALLVLALLAAAPFWLSYTPAPSWGTGLETAAGSRAADLVTVFGLLGALLVVSLALAIPAGVRARTAAVALGLGALAFAMRGGGAALAVTLCATGAMASWYADDAARRAASLLAALAAGTIAAAEWVYVSDRMNTVFKFQLQAWLLAGVAAGALTPGALAALGTRVRRPAIVLLGLLGAAALGTSVASTLALLNDPRMASAAMTLDGTRYLERLDPDSAAAYRWLNEHVAGAPVLIEATGPPYGESTRVAMHTGLPTPVGWRPHLIQQGRAAGDIALRGAQVDRFYSTTDLVEAGALLDRFRADFVFVGPLERRRYAAAGLAKLERWSRLEPVFAQGTVRVYATPGAIHATKTWLEPVLPADDAARPRGGPAGAGRGSAADR